MGLQDLKDDLAALATGSVRYPDDDSPIYELARRAADLFAGNEKTGVRSSAKLAKILGEDVETAAALYRYLFGDT